jgi:hypothetical protein
MENEKSTAPLVPLKIQPDGIPDLLKQLDRWVVWKAKPKNNGEKDQLDA